MHSLLPYLAGGTASFDGMMAAFLFSVHMLFTAKQRSCLPVFLIRLLDPAKSVTRRISLAGFLECET